MRRYARCWRFRAGGVGGRAFNTMWDFWVFGFVVEGSYRPYVDVVVVTKSPLGLKPSKQYYT